MAEWQAVRKRGDADGIWDVERSEPLQEHPVTIASGLTMRTACLIAAAPEMREFIGYQANLIDTLIERLGEAELIDEMDRVEFNKWSQAFQQMVAKAEAPALTPAVDRSK